MKQKKIFSLGFCKFCGLSKALKYGVCLECDKKSLELKESLNGFETIFGDMGLNVDDLFGNIKKGGK